MWARVVGARPEASTPCLPGANLPQQGQAATGEPGQSPCLVHDPGHDYLVAGRTVHLHGVVEEHQWAWDVDSLDLDRD